MLDSPLCFFFKNRAPWGTPLQRSYSTCAGFWGAIELPVFELIYFFDVKKTIEQHRNTLEGQGRRPGRARGPGTRLRNPKLVAEKKVLISLMSSLCFFLKIELPEVPPYSDPIAAVPVFWGL